MRERDAKCILQKLYCTKFKKLNKDHESTKYIPMPRKLRNAVFEEIPNSWLDGFGI